MTQKLTANRYSSPLGYLPSSRCLMVVLVVAFPVTFFASDFFGPTPRVWLFAVNFGALFVLAGPWHYLAPVVRSFGVKRAAERLKLSYRWRENIEWLPPSFRHRSGAETKYFNILRGRVGGVNVRVFDIRMEWAIRSTSSSGRRISGSATHSEYSVIQVQSRRKLPRLTLNGKRLSSHGSLPIAGTKYYLHLPDKHERQRAVRLITDPLVEFLAAHPRLAIDVDGENVAVSDKSWTNRRRTPGNLPALLNDVLGLVKSFEAGLDDDEPRTRFSLEAAEASLPSNRGVYTHDRLRMIQPCKSHFGQECLAAFGLIWTVMCVLIFSMFFLGTVGQTDEQSTLMAVFFCLFMPLGIGMMLPWSLQKLNTPGSLLKKPVVTVSGPTHLPGNTLDVRFRQRYRGPDSLRAATVQLTLALKDGELTPNQKTFWSTEDKRPARVVNNGGSIELNCRFAVPASVRTASLDAPWWSIAATTEVNGQPHESGTFYLPGEWLGRELVMPGIFLGVAWGLWIGGGGTEMLAEYLVGDLPGWLFGIVALCGTAGPILGGVLGYKISRVVARWPVIRPCAAVFGRLNFFLQFFLSAVLIAISLLAVGSSAMWLTSDSNGERNQESRQRPAWTMNISEMDRITDDVTGRVHFQQFVLDRAKLENGILSFQQGSEADPDIVIDIHLALDKGQTVVGKRFAMDSFRRSPPPNSGAGTPHIQVSSRPKGDNIAPRRTEQFIDDYALILEFGSAIRGGGLQCRIYLCLPDKAKSTIAGCFFVKMSDVRR